MTPSEFFGLSEIVLKKIANEILYFHESQPRSNCEDLLNFAKLNYKGKKYIFAVNFCGYIYGQNSILSEPF